MPKIRPLTESERLDKSIKEQLCGKMHVEHMNGEELALKIGVTRNTLYRRIKSPETFTLREIRELKKVFPGVVIE